MLHELVPHHAGPGLHPYVAVVLAHHIDPRDLVQQHDTGEVLGEEHIAATAQHQARAACHLGMSEQLPQLPHAGKAGQHGGAGRDVEGVQAGEIGVVQKSGYGHDGRKFTGGMSGKYVACARITNSL
jgi:hypothetical protein